MIYKLSFLFVIPFFTLPSVASALSASAVSNPLSLTEPLRLSEKDVLELVLKQGRKVKELHIQRETQRIDQAKTLAGYDWSLAIESGFESDRSKSWSPSVLTGNQVDRFKSVASFQKPLTSGTTLGLEIQRLTLSSENNSTGTWPSPATQHSYGLSLEQSLWGNSFGAADRASLSLADKTQKAEDLLVNEDLEELAFQTLRQFWELSLAEDNYQQAIASLESYQRLLKTSQKKAKFGSANPGELALVQAEVENRFQGREQARLELLNKQEGLVTSLFLNPGTQIKTLTPKKTTLLDLPPKASSDPGLEQMRLVRAQILKIEASEDKLQIARSDNSPKLSLVGKAQMTGADEGEAVGLSQSELGAHPKYYAGIKFTHSFGSDFPKEDLKNKQANLDLEKARLERLKAELETQRLQIQRKIEGHRLFVESAQKANLFRQQIVKELTLTQRQGRTDLKVLIEAMNNQLISELTLRKLWGEFQLALVEKAALEDQLIP